MSDRRLLLGALLLLILVASQSGCIRPVEPHLAIRVLTIEQESHAASEGSEPQVSFNVTMNITNDGTVRYEVQGRDFKFDTDTGIVAFVGGWRPLPVIENSSARLILEPGAAGDFELFAYQLGSSHGNITAVRFRAQPAQPVLV